MKINIPKILASEKDHKEDIDRLINYNPKSIPDLEKSIEYFLEVFKEYEELAEENNQTVLWDQSETEEVYNEALCLVSKVDYYSEDIDKLINNLSESENYHKLGLFFSALINNVIKYNETLSLYIPKEIDDFGAFFSKGVLVANGDLGAFPGEYMTGGLFKIMGNAGYCAGIGGEGGVLYINKNSGDKPGWVMKGGNIIVQGNSGRKTGGWMKGGKIYVMGNIESIVQEDKGENSTGRIYQNKKLVWPR